MRMASGETRCTCGAREEDHYDGVQCPLGYGLYDDNRSFEPAEPATQREPDAGLDDKVVSGACAHCGKSKRGHFKSNRYSMWFCNDGSGRPFKPSDPVVQNGEKQ